MQTNELIQVLTRQADPVRPLLPPSRRTLVWFAIALPYLAIVVLVMSPRPDLADQLNDALFLIKQAAALVTAVTAAIAAFTLIVPGRDRRWALLPLAPLVVWLASLGAGFLQHWGRSGLEGLPLQIFLACPAGIAFASALPTLAIIVMLRRGAPLWPPLTVALAALAVGALGYFGLRLFCPLEASLMILVWQFGMVALLSFVGWCCGHRVLYWRYRPPAQS